MEKTKIVKELVRRCLEFRGEITLEKALQLPGFDGSNIEYACRDRNCETLLYFAKRQAPAGGKVGDAKTDCEDILITVDNTNDDTKCHYVLECSWHIPEMCSKENPDGVYYLTVDEDCYITSCSHICGCCSENSWHFDEQWDNRNAFDAVAGCRETMGFLSETCTICNVPRPGYRHCA